MFAINGPEGLLLVLWLIGVVCAVANYSLGRRGLGGVLLVAAAIVVPVVGSLFAVVVFALDERARRSNHPATP
jgi:hypothetical protein